LILFSLQNLCDKKAATALAQSRTSIMVVFLFNENIVGDMAASHQVKKHQDSEQITSCSIPETPD